MYETKVCKICGEEKPIGEFPIKGRNGKLRDTKCKVCSFFQRRENNLIVAKNWIMKEYKILIDNLLNKTDILNNIVILLNNKTIEDVIYVLQNFLNIRGVKISINVECEYCTKVKPFSMTEFLKNKHHFCSKECYDKW